MLVKRPIYNDKLQCVALEILPQQNSAPDAAISSRLLELIALTDMQVPILVPFGMKPYLEASPQQLHNPIILKINAEDIENTYPLQELNDCLFSIALLIDNVQQLAWVNFAEYIVVTERLMKDKDATKVMHFSKVQKRKVIAYDIEELESFNKCKAMKVDFYCGNFIFNPSEEEQTEVAGNKLSILSLIDTLQQDDCNFDEVSDIIQTDPLLSFQLLKLANSAGFSTGATVDSIGQAIARMGLMNLKKWVMFLSMKNISNKPKEILESGLVRAHMAEQIAQSEKEMNGQSAYTAGLLSILDCLLNKPMAELLEQITISDEIKRALKANDGPLGKLLSLVIAYEKGDWLQVDEHAYPDIDLSKLYIESLELAANGSLSTMD